MLSNACGPLASGPGQIKVVAISICNKVIWQIACLVLDDLPTYLMNRHDIAQANTQVLADNLVHTDLVLIDCVVRENNANSVLALLALQVRGRRCNSEELGPAGPVPDMT